MLRWELKKQQHSNLSVNKANSIQLDNIYSLLSYIEPYPKKDDIQLLNALINILKNIENLSTLEIELSLLNKLIEISKYYSKSNIIDNYNYKNNLIENNVNLKNNIIEHNSVISAIQFIEDNFTESIDVNDISNYVHLSYSYLSRLFKKHTGVTIIDYLNNLRLKKAQYLLKCSNKKVYEIANELGFSNQYYFCNTFKKSFNISPADFRKIKHELTE